MKTIRPWVHSATVDGAFILAPAWLITALIAAIAFVRGLPEGLSNISWLVLVVGFDVAHVYSTLFRTYLDPRERAIHGSLLILVPLFCWAGASMLYALSAAAFWTGLAYLAVFHFVRQQYGLVMLYTTETERSSVTQQFLDAAVIYSSTVYPLVYWHTHLPRAFDWFVDGDFLPLPPVFSSMAGIGYALIATAYVGNEVWQIRRGRALNLPKLLLITGTALSWYIGMVVFNSDFAFTAINVISHAVPYFALVWIYGNNRDSCTRPLRSFFSVKYLPALFALVVLLAFFEEGLWDGFVWRDHAEIFGTFWHLPSLSGNPWLAYVAPLLILPQLTHYVLDAFIWRLRSDVTWKRTLLLKPQLEST